MDKTLYELCTDGSLVLTVNDRLSRYLAQEYDLEQQRLGLQAWFRPDILSLSAWLSRCQPLLPGSPLFLNKPQLQHVWEMIVEADSKHFDYHLLQVPQTARRALQAHQLLISYAAQFGVDDAAEDHRAFLRWRKAWLEESVVKGWHDPVEVPWLLADTITRGHLQAPKKIVLAGFDEITPDLTHLKAVMEKRGTIVSIWHPQPCRDVQRHRFAATDAADEVSRCSRWIRSLLASNPAAKVGVVAPQLDIYRSHVECIFRAELEPVRLLAGEEMAQVFNLSLGQSLDREGVVKAAIRILRLAMRVNQGEVSWLLCTPYLGKAIVEHAARAQCDRELRRLRHFDWTLPRLEKTLAGFAKKFAIAIPDFVETLSVLAADLRKAKKHLPGFWAEHFAAFLHKAGWPGDRGLSSREYQAMQHFQKVLGELASLDGVSQPMDRSSAAAILARMISNVEFQPEGSNGPVQVLGALESSGMAFDHLWVLGLHDGALPSIPRPNPFIPLPVQRRHQMKRSDAEREYRFAEQVVARLFTAAPDIICSWPAREKGVEQRPSPFLKDLPEGQPPLADSCAPDQVFCSKRPVLEEVDDSQGPPLATQKPFAGGTSIIKDQALCPFRAFAHHRLRAEGLDVPDIGIDNLARGTLVHTVLELFWANVVDQNTLLSLDEVFLARHLNQAVANALDRIERERRCDLPVRQRHIEHQRLIALVLQWLDGERLRGPFRVLAAEKAHQIKLGDLIIRTRIDRIDELDDGSWGIIDYKTGRTDPQQWLDDRITEPQLPAYCLGLPRDKVGAVMFAVVRGKEQETGFRGLARNMAAWPEVKSRSLEARLEERGWGSFDEVLDHWEKALTSLGDAFAQGSAAVDPVDPVRACQYCDLVGLCRILEQEPVLQEERSD